MATAELPQRPGIDMQGVASLANLFLGKTGTSTQQNSGGITTTGTRTVTDSASPEAVMALVNSIMEGSQGLASVAAGENKVGLYNSSTNRLLVNDLMARASAEGAKLNKSQTTAINETQADNRQTATTNVAQPQIKPSTGLGLVAGAQILGKAPDIISGGKKLLGKLGVGASAASAGSQGSGGNSAPVNDGTANPQSSALPTSANVSAANPAANVGFNPADINGLDITDPTQSVGSLSNPTFDVGDLSFDQTADFSGFDYGAGSGIDVSQIGGASGPDIDGTLDFGTDFGGGDYGPDPTSVEFEDFNTDFADMFNFAEGGLVTKDGNDNVRRRYVNVEAEKAFNSGGDEAEKKDNPSEERKEGFDFFRKTPAKTAGNDPRASEADYKPHKSLAVKIIDRLTGRDKVPGYASGGMVDITNMGLRAKEGKQGSPLNVATGDQLIDTVMRKQKLDQTGDTASLNSDAVDTRGTRPTNFAVESTAGARPHFNNGRRSSVSTSGGGEGSASTAADSPSTAAPGVDSGIGPAASIGNTVAGLAGIGSIGPAAGLSAASSNSQAIATTVSAIASVVASPVVGMVINALIGNSGTGTSTPGVDADAANAVAAINDSDPLDAFVSQIDAALNGANNAAAAAPGTVGDSSGAAVGDSSGNSVGADGDGGVGAGGGDGGSFKTGGSVKGPGTATSDSIDAKLSDGEYVINAAAVEHFGKDFFDMINDAVKPHMANGGMARASYSKPMMKKGY